MLLHPQRGPFHEMFLDFKTPEEDRHAVMFRNLSLGVLCVVIVSASCLD